jgi:hypothetical protein
MKAKIKFGRLKLENLKKSSFYYLLQLHPRFFECKRLKGMHRYREIFKFATYDCVMINFIDSQYVDFINRWKL